MSFSQDQLSRVGPIWEKMLGHRFLLETRDGTIADETFARKCPERFDFEAAEAIAEQVRQSLLNQ